MFGVGGSWVEVVELERFGCAGFGLVVDGLLAEPASGVFGLAFGVVGGAEFAVAAAVEHGRGSCLLGAASSPVGADGASPVPVGTACEAECVVCADALVVLGVEAAEVVERVDGAEGECPVIEPWHG